MKFSGIVWIKLKYEKVFFMLASQQNLKLKSEIAGLTSWAIISPS